MVRTFQITRALAAMPVIDNMMLAAPDQPGERFRNLLLRPGAVRRREREVHAQATELLEVFDLADLAGDYAGTLSGGQRKLLELARALMTQPTLLLLDEPMAGINPTLGRRLLDHMQRLRREQGMTFLFVEHDMEVVMNHSDRVIVMAEGKVIAAGEPHRGARGSRRHRRLPRGCRMTGNDPLLVTEDLVAGYAPGVDILDGVSLSVREGEIATVVGPNGAGKSTLIRTIFGLLRPRRGRVTLRGDDLTGLEPHSIARRGMSYVPQLDNVFPSLSVEENLEMGSLDRSHTRERIGGDVRALPAPGRATQAGSGHDERRREADAGNGAGADAKPTRPLAR